MENKIGLDQDHRITLYAGTFHVHFQVNFHTLRSFLEVDEIKLDNLIGKEEGDPQEQSTSTN